MRRIIQVLFLILFSLLFFLAADPLYTWIPVDLFLKADPLIAITTFLSVRTIYVPLLLSLIVVAASFFFGRIFCGYVCPLGTIIDLSKKAVPARKTTQPEAPGTVSLINGKYYILLFVLICSLFGFNLVYLFDPIAFLTRVYTFLLYPLIPLLLNAGLDFSRPLAEKLHWVSLAHKQYMQPLFYMNLITLLLFITALFLSFFAERFWCRNICPLGALLSLFSRWNIFKRQVHDSCNRCMKCYRECPMGAIPQEPAQTIGSECIQCLHCSTICPQSAISFKPVIAASPKEFNKGLSLTRRSLFLSLGAGAVGAFTLKATPFAKLSHPALIRPPGALPEQIFLKHCVRCGECMKVCLTNTLQPCLWESGLEGLWSPRLLTRLAGCDQTCNLCGQVCPTGAIRNLPLEEKRNAKMGTAVIDRERCLVWEQNKLCLICDEQCPYNAIIFKWHEGFRRPFVIASKCNGCGFCEQKCPVKGASAIVVTPRDEIRLAAGSYIEAAHKLQLEFKEDPGTDRFLLEENPAGEPLGEESANSRGSAKEKLPEGFTVK
jgi:MauM/NapG family ferredoxin protein